MSNPTGLDANLVHPHKWHLSKWSLICAHSTPEVCTKATRKIFLCSPRDIDVFYVIISSALRRQMIKVVVFLH